MNGSVKSSANPDWAALLSGRDDSPFWIDLIRRRSGMGDSLAMRVRKLLEAFPEVVPGPRESVSTALQELSSAVLDLVNDQELPEIEVTQATLFWTNRINNALEQADVRLRLRKIYPNDRFDHDTMESVSTVTGYHLTVARALTWTIVEMGDERSRVIHRAKVVTS